LINKTSSSTNKLNKNWHLYICDWTINYYVPFTTRIKYEFLSIPLRVPPTWKIALNYNAIVTKNNLIGTNKPLKCIYCQLKGCILLNWKHLFGNIVTGRGLNHDFLFNNGIFATNGQIGILKSARRQATFCNNVKQNKENSRLTGWLSELFWRLLHSNPLPSSVADVVPGNCLLQTPLVSHISSFRLRVNIYSQQSYDQN